MQQARGRGAETASPGVSAAHTHPGEQEDEGHPATAGRIDLTCRSWKRTCGKFQRQRDADDRDIRMGRRAVFWGRRYEVLAAAERAGWGRCCRTHFRGKGAGDPRLTEVVDDQPELFLRGLPGTRLGRVHTGEQAGITELENPARRRSELQASSTWRSSGRVRIQPAREARPQRC